MALAERARAAHGLVAIPQLQAASAFAFLEALSRRHPGAAKEFKAVFVSGGGSVAPHIVIGLGSKLTVDVSVGGGERVTSLRSGRELLSEEVEWIGTPGIPYPRAFGVLAERTAELEPELEAAPLLGAWDCVADTRGLRPVCSFTLPRIIVSGSAGEFDVFTFDEDIELPSAPELRGVEHLWSLHPAHGRVIADIPDHETYMAGLAGVLDALRDGELSKLVVARKRIVDVSERIGLSLISRISRTMAPEYSYYFRWDDGKEWFGASPETLLRRTGPHIVTAPLAGTMRVGAGAAAEHGIREALLRDPKEDVEHRRAVELLLSDLAPLCEGLGLDESKSLVRTPYAYHIKSEISGHVNPELSSFDVLSRIYPPATIWGTPRIAAGSALRAVEPFERERFAGGFGYVAGTERADFALGIRTASLQRGRLSVFAGSGIVEASEPEREWDECRLKMTPFLSALDLEES